MQRSPGGPAIVLALVLAEMGVGGLAALWVVPAWGVVKDGFFKLTGAILSTLAILAWLAARGSLVPAAGLVPASAEIAVALLAAFAGLTVLWQVLLWVGVRKTSRVVGIAAVPAGVGALIAIALDPGASNAPPITVFQLVAGALFAGAVTDGLLLGHWHLVDRKAAREPLARLNTLFLTGAPLAAVAVLLGGTRGGTARPDLSPLLGVGVLTVSIAVGLMALCALIGFFVRALIRESSIQSATGLLYLGVIMAFAAEFAAKVRFF